MGLEEVRLAAELRVGGILCLAERMPGIVTASSCREFDGIALAKASSAFGTIRSTEGNPRVIQFALKLAF